MEKIEKRNEIRISYQIEILNLLRKGKKTITEIANNLGVSFTAISHIVDELEKANLLRYTDKQQSKTRGRNPVYVELNCNKGVVCSINFSTLDIRIVISTLDTKIIVEKSIKNVKYLTKEILEEIEAVIKELLEKPEIKNRQLLSICIASPGLIRPDSFEYVRSRRLHYFDLINPVQYLTNAFNVRVEMHNDVRLGCLAELKFGAFPKKAFDGLFIHIGFSSGLALVFDGKIYKGSNGFSGETPVYIGEDDITLASRWNSRFFSICEIDRLIKVKRGIPLPDFEEVSDFDKILKEYEGGNKETIEAVEESAMRNAMTIFGLATILDVNYIVIEGRILEFGTKYLDLMRKNMNEFASTEIRARIAVSNLKEESSILGACYQASSIYFRDVIENSTKDKFNIPDFVLEEKYREL